MKKALLLSLVLLLSISGFAQQTYYSVTPGNGYGLRFWNDDSYKIHMGTGTEYFFGPVQDYSIKMNMSGGTPSRGWTWGVAGQTPVGALSAQGHFQVAGNLIANGGLYFTQSGTAPDGLPQARFNEAWGIRFNSPDPRWVFSSKPSVLIGYQPNGTDWGNDNLFVAGNIGIGTTSPSAKVQINGNGGGTVDLTVNGRISTGDSGNAGGVWVSPANNLFVGQNNTTSIGFYNNGSWRLVADNNGNVGIGTESPDSKLTVKGTIHTQEVKVDLNGSVAPDYVFEKDYPLTSLEDLKSYIDQNKHLPEVPSAKEMEKEGINLKEMNLLLLKKLEELTIHIIHQNIKLEEEKKLNIVQSRELVLLRSELERIVNQN